MDAMTHNAPLRIRSGYGKKTKRWDPQRGITLAGLIVALAVLGALAAGGYYAWSYYQALNIEHELSKSLDTVHRYRGRARVGKERVRKHAEELLREAGGELAPGAVRVSFAKLTAANASELPAMLRQKLSLACYNQRLQDRTDHRIDRARAALRGDGRRAHRGRRRRSGRAGRGGRSGRAARNDRGKEPSTRPPPLRPGAGVSCDPDRLAEMGYTLVRVEATAQASAGWVSRDVDVKRVFYLAQPPEQ